MAVHVTLHSAQKGSRLWETIFFNLPEKAREYKQPGARCPISLRTLEIGVEIAEGDPESWQELLENAIPTVLQSPANVSVSDSGANILSSLGQSGMNVEQQFAEFHRTTGKSRRAFFYQRKKLGLSRQTQEQAMPVS